MIVPNMMISMVTSFSGEILQNGKHLHHSGVGNNPQDQLEGCGPNGVQTAGDEVMGPMVLVKL